MSSALIRASSSCPVTAASIVSMCWTRSNVGIESWYSSSTPSVYGSPAPERVVEDAPADSDSVPVIEDGKACFPVTGKLLDLPISTFHLGSKRPARTVVLAGRTSPKTSACARAKPSKSSALVR